LVRSSKNGFGRPSPRIHQPRIFDVRRANVPSDGDGGAFGGSGALVDTAQRHAQHLVARMASGFAVHERMNECDDREARAGGGVGDRRAATPSVPAKDLAGEADTTQSVPARGECHTPCRHLKNVRAAGGVENVRPPEEAGERLTVLAVAEEAQAG
jgi:hypothetical protein